MLQFLNRLGSNEHVTLSVIALIIGLAVGYASILFRMLIDAVQFFAMGSGGDAVVGILEGLAWWQLLLIPATGGLIVGPLIHFVFPKSRGHGVPEVMESVALHGARMKLQDGIGKMIACSISIGCGGSVGREGPVVHVGATVASWFGQKLRLSTKHMRTMVGCGAAAGIAASFNAPIAGVMFALEVILADYGLATFSPIVLSSVVATVVARLHLGDFPAFIVPHYTLISIWEIPAYVGLGVLCGVTGIAFMRTLFFAEDQFAKIPVPIYLRPFLGGLAIGMIGLLFPQVMGVGYETMNVALLEQMTGVLMFGLVIVKILATSITLGSGFSGGVFTPSLFLGAMVGGAFGTYAHALFPAISASSGAYTLVGMGAMAASVLGAPISCILILFELTGDYKIMLALMVSAIVATLVIHQVYRDSVYTRSLHRRDIDLRSGREANILRRVSVGSIMQRECEVVPESMTIHSMKEKIRKSRMENFLVVDHSGQLSGIVSFQDVTSVALDQSLENLVLVRDIATKVLITVTPTDNLYTALRRIGSGGVEQLPVVAEDNSKRVLGIVTNNDIIQAYNKALMDQESLES